jgi:hypothetical protein
MPDGENDTSVYYYFSHDIQNRILLIKSKIFKNFSRPEKESWAFSSSSSGFNQVIYIKGKR